MYCDEKKIEAFASRRGKGYDEVRKGLCTHVHDAITRMNRIWNVAS